MKDKHIQAPKCNSEDNIHRFEDTSPPWFGKCKTCGVRFMMISEPALLAMGYSEDDFIPRPIFVQ